MRHITLAFLITISFAFRAGDADVELLDICSLEAAIENAKVQEAEAEIRLKRYAKAARRARMKASAKAAATVKKEQSAAAAAEAKTKAAVAEAQAAIEESREIVRVNKEMAGKAPRKPNARALGAGASSATIDSLLRLATSLEGVRYVSGGNSVERGFDCSGFVNYVFRKFGFKIGRSSRDQAVEGAAVAREEARPGDIVVFSRGGRKGGVFHAGLIVEATDQSLVMIHANQRGGVHQVDIDGDSYWRPKVHSIRRVL